MLMFLVWLQVVFVCMIYGPIAAYLVEAFPAKVRYTSVSLPYHIGNGVFGGLLPLIGLGLCASTGNIYAGLYYPMGVAALTFVVGVFLLKETHGTLIWEEVGRPRETRPCLAVTCPVRPRLGKVTGTRAHGAAGFVDAAHEPSRFLLPPKDVLMSSFRLPASQIRTWIPLFAKIASFPRRRNSAGRPTSRASSSTRRCTSGPSRIRKAFWAEAAKELHWFKPWDKVLEWNLPWAKWFVGGKMNLCYNCVDRHALGSKSRQDRHHLGGRARRSSPPDLCRTARRSAAVRQRPEGAGHQEGRPRRRLHGHDAGTGHRAAGLRAHRRGALGDLRRIRRQRHRRPRERFGLRGDHHPGHQLSPRQRDPAQAHRGRSHEGLPHREARGGVPAHRHRR